MTWTDYAIAFTSGAISAIVFNFIMSIFDHRRHKKLVITLMEANELADKCIVLLAEKKLNEQQNATEQ